MKASMRQTRRKPSPGFTLIEVLVVLIIIGVLFAISAPSWTALMNRQRVGTVREQAVQVIREAQNKARLTRVPQAVVFDNNNNDGTIAPRTAIVARSLDLTKDEIDNSAINLATINNWQTLGGGDVKGGGIDFFGGQLVFDGNGAVDKQTAIPFVIKVKPRNASPQTYRCAVVQTLLGSIRLTDGEADPAICK